MTIFQRQWVERRRGLLMIAVLAWSLYLLLMGAGCATSQSMVMHLAVADVDKNEPTVKFYRVRINASSSNLKSTLRTGYYNAEALRDVFGDVRASDRPRDLTQKIGTVAFAYEPGTKSWRALPPDELFTVIYGADAQALEASVRAFADSDEAGKTLGRLLAAAAGKAPFVDAATAEQRRKAQLAAAKLVAAEIAKQSTAVKAVGDKLTSALADAGANVPGATTGGAATTPPVATAGANVGNAGSTGGPSATSPGASASAGSATPAADAPKPSEIEGVLLKIAKETAKQLGSSVVIDGAPDKGFPQVRQLYEALKQSDAK